MCFEVDGQTLDDTGRMKVLREIEEESKFVPAQFERAPKPSLIEVFELFLLTRRDHRDGLSTRQQLWLAFEAGAKYVMQELAP